jgi:AraC family transcriptional regulator
MASSLIVPDQLPIWVPGRVTVRSPDDGWHGVSVRGYRYNGSDVEVPPMRDYMIVAYRRGVTPMRRRFDGRWSEVALGPGDVSLLTRAAPSHWVWPKDIEVVHAYLTESELAATCQQMCEREVSDIELHDTLQAGDPAIHRTAMMLAAEAAQGGAGSSLLVESLACQLSVYILRRHAEVRFRDEVTARGLSPQQRCLISDYVQTHLNESISLTDLAGAVALSRYHFARGFRAAMGMTPHEFVQKQRVAKVQLMLHRTRTPLHEIASACGFADQSHMTRVFKQHLGVTPGKYRLTVR